MCLKARILGAGVLATMQLLRRFAHLPAAACVIAAASMLAPCLWGEQNYVTRYDAYVGYAFLDSPRISLFENGVAFQAGFRPRTWFSVGFDYSFSKGDATITPDLLTTELQQQLGAQLAKAAAAGLLPPGYELLVPIQSETHTFAFGPQLAYRRFTHATLFARPVFAGAIHEIATPVAQDPIAKAVVAQLAPSGTKTDTTWFLGFGGGFDILLSKHFAIRAQADWVYDHLFSDLLRDGRYTTRFSIGPAFNFGRNIAQ
jgi:hypothetical protein